jgi:hypothetical protein
MHSRIRLANRDDSPLRWLDREAAVIFSTVVDLQSM